LLMGWAQTLARPGGMITGVFEINANSKRFELLKEVRPQATTFCFLMNANNPINPVSRKLVNEAAPALGINLEIVEVKEPSEFPDAFDRMRSLGGRGPRHYCRPSFFCKFRDDCRTRSEA